MAPGSRRLAFVSLLLAGLPATSAAQTFPEPPPIEAARAPEHPLAYAPGVHVLHYDLEIGVGETTDWFAGRARIRVLAGEDGPILPLDLTGLAVDGIRVDGAAAPAGVHYVDGVLSVPLSDARSGDTVTVTVAYSGSPDDALDLGHNVDAAPSAFGRQLAQSRPVLVSVGGPSVGQGHRAIHYPRPGDVEGGGQRLPGR